MIDCANGLTVLKSGSAKTELFSEDGDQQIVAFHFPGDLLCIDAFKNQQVISSITFLEKSVVCVIPLISTSLLTDNCAELKNELISRLRLELGYAHKSLLYMNNFSAEQRLAVFLLDLSHRQKKRGLAPNYLCLSMCRSDIGNYLGLASETVSRTISRFERDGLIKAESRQLQLINFSGLIAVAHCCPKCKTIFQENPLGIKA